MKFLVVGIDYFTKWVEAEPLARIIEQNVKSFVQKNIICRFGISRVLVSNNGWQFENTPFREFCEQLGIRNHYFSPSYPQANRQVEVTNRFAQDNQGSAWGVNGIWPDKLPSVLWAYRMIVRTPTGETPFKMAYGNDAVIPAKVGLTSFRLAHYQDEENGKQLLLSLDLMDEVKMDAEQKVAHYKT